MVAHRLVRIPKPLRWLMAAVLGLGLLAGAVEVGAANTSTAAGSCNAPAKSGSSYTITCTIPVVTQTVPGPTVTVPGPTVTVSAPVSSPPNSPSAASSTPATSPVIIPTPSAATSTASSPTGFPDASDTGVPASMVLRSVPGQVTSGPGWAWVGGNEDCIHVTSAATLSGLSISGCVEIYSNNVTLSDDLISTSGEGWGVGVRGFSGALIEDTTIAGTAKAPLLVGVKDVTGSSSVTVLRANVAFTSTGVQLSRGVLQDSYIHDMALVDSSNHVNGFTDNGGRTDGSMLIEHNRIIDQLDQADAISLFEDFGAIQNVTVDSNLIAGGSYTLYAGHNDGGKATNHVVITNNEFMTAPPSAFGPACCFDHGSGNAWSGNAWVDGPSAGQAVAAPYND